MADIQLPGFWREDRLLSFFLAFLVLMTIVVPMLGLSRPGRIAIDLTFALMLLSGAIATVNKRLLMFLIIALTILEFTADLIVEFNPSFSPRGWDTALKVFCMAILVVMTLKHTFLFPGPVTVHRVMGGIAAYLLIGVTWAFAYKLLMEEIPDAIYFPNPAGSRSSHRRTLPSDLFQLRNPHDRLLRRQQYPVPSAYCCAIYHDRRSPHRATLSCDPDRNIGRHGAAGAVQTTGRLPKGSYSWFGIFDSNTTLDRGSLMVRYTSTAPGQGRWLSVPRS